MMTMVIPLALSLCNLCVLCVSVVDEFRAKNTQRHRGCTEITAGRTRNRALADRRGSSPGRKHACGFPLSAIRPSLAPDERIRGLRRGKLRRSLPWWPHAPSAPRPTSSQIVFALVGLVEAADASTKLLPNSSAALAVGLVGSDRKS